MHRTILLALLPTVALATPIRLGHQGRLLDTAGTPLEGNHRVELSLRDGSDAVEYTEVFDPLSLQSGYYSVVLGTGDGLDSSVLAAPELYVAVTVDGALFDQRSLLVSSPYAARARVAERVDVLSTIDGVTCDDPGRLVVDESLRALRVCIGTSWITLGTKTIVQTETGRAWSDGTAAASCLDYLEPSDGFEYAGIIGDGDYRIDADGPGPLPEALVECDMTGGGWTLFHHNREARFVANGVEGPREHRFPVTYEAPIDVITAVRDAATQVQQYMLKECTGSVIVDSSGTSYTGWVYPPSQLAAGTLWPNHTTCDINDTVARQAGGTVTNASVLPVIRIDNGDTGDTSETSAFTLGPFRVR